MVYFDGTVAFRMWAICRQGVLLIEQNSNIACPEFAIDRCALTSELQALADETMGEFEGPEPLHYACLLDIGEDADHLGRRNRRGIKWDFPQTDSESASSKPSVD